MSKRAILCDIGNVLVHFDFRPAARRLALASEFAEDEVLTRLEPLKIQLEDGQLADEAFIAAAMDAIHFTGSAADFAAIWCAIFSANEPMRASLSALAGRLPLDLLSNTSGLHRDYLFRSFEVFQIFADGVYSYAARSSKPSPRIFDEAIRSLQLDPARTLFIDDLEANIATARTLGFVTHHYHPARHAEFDAHLTAWMAGPPHP